MLRSRVYVAGNLALSVALLGVAGALLLPVSRQAVNAALARAQPTRVSITITGPGVGGQSATIQAYILGDVAAPGVYTLSADARVQDLLAAAGGALPDADLRRVDLAAHVADGQEVYVPQLGETVPLTLGGKIDINVASAADLHNALHIENATAERIVAYRAAHGPFTAISQLLLTPISRATYDRIKDLITV